MKLSLVRQEKTGAYEIRCEGGHLGVFSEAESLEMGSVGVFSVESPGFFMRNTYIYPSPKALEEWLPKEVRDEANEDELYSRASAEADWGHVKSSLGTITKKERIGK